jgi:dehydrogenase/reductase SDR family protein X
MNFIKKIFWDFYIFLKMLILGSCSLISEMCCFVQPIKSKKKNQESTQTKNTIKHALNFSNTLTGPINREKEYVVVTGGNRGIGWSTVKALAESGMKVIVGKQYKLFRKLLKLYRTYYCNLR